MQETPKDKDFFQQVYAVVRLIPQGKVCTYGIIAEYLGSKRAARMVGWAMNQAHSYSDIPAHRVVNRKGLLTGKHHFDSPNEMQELLEKEGIVIIDSQIQDFENLIWNPFLEL
jgi:methylated-DNA-protein-cysteine methyltransferase-like protein